jgi:hypothetical protein
MSEFKVLTQPVADYVGFGPSSWARVDLGPALVGKVDRVTPTILRFEQMAGALFYAGRVNGVHGDSGDGKTWAAAIATAQELEAGNRVLWVDLEDDESVICERLRDVLNVPVDTVLEGLHYYRPVEPFDADAIDQLVSEVLTHEITLAVIDSLGEAFGLEGLNEDKDVEVGPWLRRVARPLADAGAAVLLIDHSTKAKDNQLFPSGSKRKRAAITGSSFFLDAITPLTRESGGRLRLTCAKDRHGTYRRGEVVAVFDFFRYPDGGMSVKVWPPEQQVERTPGQKLRKVAEAAVLAAKTAGRELSLRELTELMDIRAAATVKRAGIDSAVIDGAILRTPGARGAHLHTYARELSPDAEDDE